MSLNGKKAGPASLMTLGAPKKSSGENFTSTIFLGPIRLDSSNGGTSNSQIIKTLPLIKNRLKILLLEANKSGCSFLAYRIYNGKFIITNLCLRVRERISQAYEPWSRVENKRRLKMDFFFNLIILHT